MRTVAVVVLVAGCAALPEQRGARGLYHDLRKTVEIREADDWVVDSLEIDNATRAAMHSVCTAPPEAREDLRLWLSTQIAASGGPSEAQFDEEGLTGDVKEVRRLERVLALLERTEDHAHECPYWIEQDEDFAGLESDEGRLVFLLETRGGPALLFSDGDVAIGGGGGGALIPAFGVSKRFTLGVGFEAGADGLLPETDSGTRSFEAVASIGVPLLMRFTNISRVVDIEASWRRRYGDVTRDGFRIAIGYGLTTPRVSAFMPYGLIWVGYGMFPAANGEAIEHSVWLGTRVGFDWDP